MDRAFIHNKFSNMEMDKIFLKFILSIHFTPSKQYIPPITSWSVHNIIDEYDLIFEIFHRWYIKMLGFSFFCL
jgi:hypothetical protein